MNTDSFVVDYTNDEDKSVAKRGVEITLQDPGYKHGVFHLIDRHKVDYYAVNFEHTPSFFTEKGKRKRSCECMFSSCYAKKKKWAMLLEMKYCKTENIESNAKDARDELEQTRDHLMKKGVLNYDEYRLYFVISFPKCSCREPFMSFLFSPEELQEYKRTQNANLVVDNGILIMNGAFLAPASSMR